MNKLKVVAGPYAVAQRYAKQKGWHPDEYMIVTRAHQIARLDPATVVAVITVKLQNLGQRIVAEIHEELDKLRALWPVPLTAAT